MPWPAITSGWSNGGTGASPSSRAISAMRVSRWAGGTSTTSAPSARTASTLSGAATSGITTTQRTPKCRAAMASAWP